MLLEGAYGIKLYNVVGMGVGNHGRRDEIWGSHSDYYHIILEERYSSMGFKSLKTKEL
jgi:hypothetical protein